MVFGLSNCAISELTMFEQKVGAQITLQKDGVNQDKKLSYLFDAVEIIPVTDAFDYAAKEKARLRLIGRPIGDDIDLLIGCSAVVNNMIMVTENIKHFENISGIRIENWVKRK